MMTWLSRGLAGHVRDKSFGVLLGERNSGKSALIGLLEEAYGSSLVSTIAGIRVIVYVFEYYISVVTLVSKVSYLEV
jgi:hypothetical protein